MDLDKDHKFNFFKKEEKSPPDFILILGLVTMVGFIVYTSVSSYYLKPSRVNESGVVAQKGEVRFGVLTAQNTFSSTAGPTFVISPANSFESLSQKEKLTHWVENQEPGVQLTPAEVQKIVKIMQSPTK